MVLKLTYINWEMIRQTVHKGLEKRKTYTKSLPQRSSRISTKSSKEKFIRTSYRRVRAVHMHQTVTLLEGSPGCFNTILKHYGVIMNAEQNYFRGQRSQKSRKKKSHLSRCLNNGICWPKYLCLKGNIEE